MKVTMALLVVAILLAVLLLSRGASRLALVSSEPAARSPATRVMQEALPAETPAAVRGKITGEADGEVVPAVDLADPRVVAYLSRERDKSTLRGYFDDPGASELSADEAWALIEQVEAEGRVMGFEALHLKLAWLERNSASEEEFQQRASQLLAQYRQRAEQAAQAGSPERNPAFVDYKQRERQIMDEVAAMDDIPNGMTRQAYLRQRLLEARMAAYGESPPSY
ncbi:hypothetical protein [Parahaliea mediterranea]|uniref:hypothetical protein n=1 Tax=Parahaliea mediterranea TaxID=651086 RepID=UPI001300910F|nr:hypothetical protein [Parahaliea mediterranea]